MYHLHSRYTRTKCVRESTWGGGKGKAVASLVFFFSDTVPIADTYAMLPYY